MIIANNILLLIAIGICMINNPWIILTGRLLYGMSAGTFTVLCPKFISEVAPTEYKGPFGAMS
jgi:MFS family permease